MEIKIEELNIHAPLSESEVKLVSIVCTKNPKAILIALYQDCTLKLYRLDGSIHHLITLVNNDQIPCSLYIDRKYIYVGFENGTVEIRDLNNHNYLKTTSHRDAGGPGKKKITSMLSTPNYFLVNTLENGLLIYLQPSLIFYKWIMIELETTIKSYSIDHNYLFILTDDNEIHLLNFQIQRLDEIPIGGFEYIDLEYDGKYLYLASNNRIQVYDTREQYYIVYSQKFRNKNITQLIKISQGVILLHEDQSISMINKSRMEIQEDIVPNLIPVPNGGVEFFRSLKHYQIINESLNTSTHKLSEFSSCFIHHDKLYLGVAKMSQNY